jgi:hypothetical protein
MLLRSSGGSPSRPEACQLICTSTCFLASKKLKHSLLHAETAVRRRTLKQQAQCAYTGGAQLSEAQADANFVQFRSQQSLKRMMWSVLHLLTTRCSTSQAVEEGQ